MGAIVGLQDSVLSNNHTSLTESYGDSLYSAGNHLLFSTDQGNNWNSIDSGLTHINTIIKNNDTLYIGNLGGAYFSANNGKTWNRIWTTSTDTAIYAITKVGNDLFLGSSESIFRSTDLGKNWVSVKNGLPSEPYIESFANIGNNIFTRTYYGIYLSTDYGDNWSEADTGFPDNAFNYSYLFRMPLIIYNNDILTGTKYGVFITKNLGSNWTAVNDGLSGDALVINSLTINGNDLYIATNNGVWKRSLAGIVSVENNNDNLPKDFLLYQNYPNPFNPSTTIQYALAKESRVTVKIYNIIGQEVITLVDEVQNIGIHKIVWSANPKLTSGVYFCHLTAGFYVDTKKLLLLK